jgi:hypothetical protein
LLYNSLGFGFAFRRDDQNYPFDTERFSSYSTTLDIFFLASCFNPRALSFREFGLIADIGCTGKVDLRAKDKPLLTSSMLPS